MSNHRILIVDDEPKVAFFFQKHLEMVDNDYTVDAVNSGEQALRALRHRQYDLLITDLNMPGMSGLELVKQVREISPDTRTMLVTAYGSSDVWQQAERLDIFRSLSKPLKIPELLRVVREALMPPKKEEHKANVVAISGENFERLAERLSQLRVDLGARLTLLCDTTGRVIAYNGGMDGFDSSTLALLGGNMAGSIELSRHLKYPHTVHLSYYEGPPYDLYAANVGRHFLLTIVYDRRKEASRIGYVWLYAQRAVEELKQLLLEGESDVSAPVDAGFAAALQGELDDLWGDEAPAEETPPPPTPTVKTAKSSSVAPGGPVHDMVTKLTRQFSQKTGIRLQTDFSGLEKQLPTMCTRLVFRSLSVLLKNIAQHAYANQAVVKFTDSGQYLTGVVQDNGRGFSEHTVELKSLARLRQQFETVGGSLTIQSRPDAGTTIYLKLPC